MITTKGNILGSLNGKQRIMGTIGTGILHVLDTMIPDWNQNDETQLDYIKNRPFYENSEGEIIKLPDKFIPDSIARKEYVDTIKETVVSGGADYAEVGSWNDDNPDNEDRLYRFVTISEVPGKEIQLANSTSQIVGTTNLKSNVGFLGNYHENDETDPSKAIVSILGVVPIKTNDTTIQVNDRVMSDDNGYAIKSSNNLGYRVIEILEDRLLSISVSPNTDMIQRIKTAITELESSVNELESRKQDTLTPGENITIDENNVISANSKDIFVIETTNSLIGMTGKLTLQNTNTQDILNFLNSGNVDKPILLKTAIKQTSIQKNYMFYLYNSQPEYNKYQYIMYEPTVGSNIQYKKYILQFDSIIGSAGSYTSCTVSVTISVIANLYTTNELLLRNNTTEYTPTSDYHPATKKYVDDNKYELPIASADTLGGIKIGENLNIDENGVVSANGQSINNNDLVYIIELPNSSNFITLSNDDKPAINEYVTYCKKINKWLPVIVNTKHYKSPILYPHSSGNFNNDNFSFVGSQCRLDYDWVYYFDFYGSWNGDVFSVSDTRSYVKTDGGPLYKNNTWAYIPTADYHPSTKKYVDDSINKVNETISSIPTHQELIDNGFDYNTHEQENMPVNYIIQDINSYNFVENDNGYYESTNTNNYSYSICKVVFNNEQELPVTISYISSGSSTSYGIFSNIDQTLSSSYSDDGATGSAKVFKNCKDESSTDVKELTYNIPAGEHFIYIKYRKYAGTSGNDSLQFKIPTETIGYIYENRKMATTKYVDDNINTKSVGTNQYVFAKSFDYTDYPNSGQLFYDSGTTDADICSYFSEILTEMYKDKSNNNQMGATLLLTFPGAAKNGLSITFWFYGGSCTFIGLGRSGGGSINYIKQYKLSFSFTLDSDNKTVTVTKATIKESQITTSDPTTNESVANKQYVDDSISAAITDALGGSY